MSLPPTSSLEQYFGELLDPREGQNIQHPLLSILGIAICAVICGADNWVDVEMFGQAKQGWLETFLDLPHGIPSHDTFGRVFRSGDGMVTRRAQTPARGAYRGSVVTAG